MTEPPAEREPTAVDPNGHPWRVPPISGIPFADDSEEARAIERIIRWSEDSAGEEAPAPGDSRGQETPS